MNAKKQETEKTKKAPDQFIRNRDGKTIALRLGTKRTTEDVLHLWRNSPNWK